MSTLKGKPGRGAERYLVARHGDAPFYSMPPPDQGQLRRRKWWNLGQEGTSIYNCPSLPRAISLLTNMYLISECLSSLRCQEKVFLKIQSSKIVRQIFQKKNGWRPWPGRPRKNYQWPINITEGVQLHQESNKCEVNNKMSFFTN